MLLSIATSMANSTLMDKTRHPHPRVLISAQSWEDISERRHSDARLDNFLRQSEREARALLSTEPVTREQVGRRLLATSRRALRRVLLWSLHFHLSGDQQFAARAEREMLAVAGFSDWNPAHFLDVAEMTAAMAIGYDWLYDELSTPARATIRQAIIEKGLHPGCDPHHDWLTRDNNWNQVCLGGLVMGALAVAEEEPQLCSQILEMARQYNGHGLKPYAPDGVYPEGPMYWAYGTSYQVLLLASLQAALGTDWDLSKAPGFLQSADALLQMTAPSGRSFNFSDGVERFDIEPALFWFARELQRPELLCFQWSQIEKYAVAPLLKSESAQSRLLPLIALWWPPKMGQVEAQSTLPLRWMGRGDNPIGVFRSSWDDANAMYLAFKGGSGVNSHAHLDAGSFVLEADGVRWARDLGMEDYNALETKGLQIWDISQNSDRWKIFRHSNLSHNTLAINDQLHNVNGHANITHFSDDAENPGAILDLSEIFQNQATKVRRGFAFLPDDGVLIRDELEGLKPGDSVRWTMATNAQIEINGSEAVLRQNGRVLFVRLMAPVTAKWDVVVADTQIKAFDTPNPDTKILMAKSVAPASGKVQIAVQLRRENSASFLDEANTFSEPNISLDQWRIPAVS
jgi:hypothetical protein